jgi:hypothetical protein
MGDLISTPGKKNNAHEVIISERYDYNLEEFFEEMEE